MKIATYILIGLLVVTLAGGAFFFLNIYKPMAVDYEKLKAGQPDILTFKRNGGGHVGIYVGEDDDCYHVLGGSQGNAMNVTRILKTRLYKARRTKWKVAQPANVRKIWLDGKGKISTNEASVMKVRNNWRIHNKQWDKFQLRFRLGKIDFLTVEVDISREFYMFTLLNFSIKNR